LIVLSSNLCYLPFAAGAASPKGGRFLARGFFPAKPARSQKQSQNKANIPNSLKLMGF
jgi:hypothetical protein